MISARFAARLGLETHPEPAVRFVVLLETARRDRVGKNKKRALVAHLLVQPLDQQVILMIEHRLQPVAADVAIARAINRVAELHVVGRHGFRDRAGGAADLEKPPRHFLAGADFRKGAVFLRVEIDLERLQGVPDQSRREEVRNVRRDRRRPGSGAAFFSRRRRVRHSRQDDVGLRHDV